MQLPFDQERLHSTGQFCQDHCKLQNAYSITTTVEFAAKILIMEGLV